MTPEGESRCVTIHDTLRFLNLCVYWWAVRWDFEVAKSVFYDSEALIIPDPDHSAVEQRFVLMGQSSCAGGRVVVNCYRAEVPRFESSPPDAPEPNNDNRIGRKSMRKEYAFTSAKPNPYIKQLKKAVFIRLEPDVIEYFKQLALENRIPYQNLINLYLLDCARVQRQRKISMQWGTSTEVFVLPKSAFTWNFGKWSDIAQSRGARPPLACGVLDFYSIRLGCRRVHRTDARHKARSEKATFEAFRETLLP